VYNTDSLHTWEASGYPRRALPHRGHRGQLWSRQLGGLGERFSLSELQLCLGEDSDEALVTVFGDCHRRQL
jgi:hypothetical protein